MAARAEDYKKALVGQMAWEGIDTPTIKFFRNIFNHMLAAGQISQSKMAELNTYTAQAARRHREILERSGYIRRMNYRSWCIAETALHDTFYTLAVRSFANAEELRRAS